MFNIIYSPLLNTLLCIGIGVIVCINSRSILSERDTKGTNYFIFWLFLTVFSMFYCPEFGDSYRGAIDLIRFVQSGEKGHYEDIYYLPLRIFPPNYYIWRFCVWGLASLFVIMIYKRLKCPSQFASIVFLTIALIPCYYYMRNSLGFAAFYLSIVVLLQDKGLAKKENKYMLAILLLVLSYFSHNSMPVYYFIVMLAFICPFNVWTIIVSIIVFPFMHRFVSDLATTFLSQSIINEDTYNLGMNYLSRENTYSLNLNGKLLFLFHYLPFLIVFIHSIKHLDKNEYNYKLNKVFLLSSYFILYLGLCFYETASKHLFFRFTNTSTFPMAIAIALYLTNRRSQKINRWFISSLAFYYLVFAFYSLK